MPDSSTSVPVQCWDSVVIPAQIFQLKSDGPTAVSAELMKLFGIWDPEGALIGQRFESSSGPNSNVLFSSNICARAMIYQGTRDGLQAAANAAGLYQKAHEINAWVFGVSTLPLVWGSPPPGYRKAEIRPRFAPIEKNFKAPEGNSHKLNLSTRDIAAILVPVDPVMMQTPYPVGFNPVLLEIVLEQAHSDTTPHIASSFESNPQPSTPDKDAMLVSHIKIANDLQIKGLTSAFRYLMAINIDGYQSHGQMLSKIVATGLPVKETELLNLWSTMLDDCRDLPMIRISQGKTDMALRRIARELITVGAAHRLREFLDGTVGSRNDRFRCLRCVCVHGKDAPVMSSRKGCSKHKDSPLVDVMDTSEGKKLLFTD
ncbi:hypothetical protein NW762_006544 [Fusarium torreyae]|uniref:Uncharacterized protein n=1 Tax=Fusarium torreyae TaxID=1237075 RepID=A0A9W8S0N9_9HYPO|nr:hypothetical protein NW762_006544 [Fusarium torreyae]